MLLSMSRTVLNLSLLRRADNLLLSRNCVMFLLCFYPSAFPISWDDFAIASSLKGRVSLTTRCSSSLAAPSPSFFSFSARRVRFLIPYVFWPILVPWSNLVWIPRVPHRGRMWMWPVCRWLYVLIIQVRVIPRHELVWGISVRYLRLH